MEEQQEKNIKNDELNISRDNLLSQISDLKKNFISVFDSLKEKFLTTYDNYYSQLTQDLKELDSKKSKYINTGEDLDKKVNENLKKILEALINENKKMSEDMENIMTNLYNKISNNNLKETEEYVNQIEKQFVEEEKKKIEEEGLNQIKEEKPKIEESQNTIGAEEQKEIKMENESETKEIEKEIKKIELNGKNKDLNIKLLENIQDYNKIIIKDMTKDIFYELEKEKEKKSFDSISSLVIKNTDLENIKLDKIFPNLAEMKIKDSKLHFEFGNTFNFENIQNLKLENIGLIDNNFNDLFDKIRSNEKIRNNLRVFSVKNNKISYIDYKRGYADNILSSMIFTKLEILDLSYNKLYYFQNQIFNCLENIKLIDLTDNNISSPQGISGLIKSAKIKNCLLLITRNLCILKEPENIEYNNYLKEILPKINYPIKLLTFDNIFCGNLYQNMFDLDFSFFKNTLTYLNLSNSQLNDSDLISKFDKWPFANLKSLILVANFLTQDFLYTISSDNKYSMNKLKTLKLSENEIKCTDVDKFKKFLEFFKNLEMLELKLTPFESFVNQFFKQKLINEHDPKNNKGFTRAFNEDEKNVEEILENNYLKEKTKIVIYILDLNGGKYTDKINQNFPKLTERLNVENKFPHKT